MQIDRVFDIYEETTVLDQGYIKVIEFSGSDQKVIEAARMSTNKGFLGWGPNDACLQCSGNKVELVDVVVWDVAPTAVPMGDVSFRYVGGKSHIVQMEEPCSLCAGEGKKPGDEKLLNFLWGKRHTSPFEMATLTIEVKAPIVVFREWHRHRTQSYSERSARYAALPDEAYMPTLERTMMGNVPTTNKQAQGSGKQYSEADAQSWLDDLDGLYDHAQAVYSRGMEIGIPKELARLATTVSRYSVMRASGNLLNWLKFLGLRCDMAAQYEIRQYANVVSEYVRRLFPRTHTVSKTSLGLPA